MKEISRDSESSFRRDPDEAAKLIDGALSFLWKENQLSIFDKVAGDYNFEELIAALICAKKKISLLEEEIDGISEELKAYREN